MIKHEIIIVLAIIASAIWIAYRINVNRKKDNHNAENGKENV